jgi:hypothetical protein
MDEVSLSRGGWSFQEFELFLGVDCSLHHGLFDVLVDGFGDFAGVGGDLLLLFGFIGAFGGGFWVGDGLQFLLNFLGLLLCLFFLSFLMALPFFLFCIVEI